MSESRAWLLWWIVAFGLTGLWRGWAHLPILAVSALGAWASAGFFFLSQFSWPDIRLSPSPVRGIKLFSIKARWASLCIILPSFVFFLLLDKGEFPFSGDQAYLFTLSKAYLKALPYDALILVLLVFVLWTLSLRFRFFLGVSGGIVFLSLLFILGGVLTGPLPLVRYPGLFNVLSTPFLAVSSLFFPSGQLWALQLTNVLALPVWLFLLRPMLLNEEPSLRILLVGILVFWWPPFIYYSSSAYLEPWACIFLLLAIEATSRTQNQDLGIAVLLISIASLIKETFIFFLPAVLLVSFWNSTGKNRFKLLLGRSCLALFPFLFFWACQKWIGPSRPIHFGWSNEILSTHFWKAVFSRLAIETGVGSFVVIGMIWIALWCATLSKAHAKWKAFFWLLGGLGILAVYTLDRYADAWLGYPRYFLPIWIAISSVVFFVELSDKTLRKLVLVVIVLLAPRGLKLLKRAHGPVTELNFYEHTDSPIYWPIRSVVSEAMKLGEVKEGEALSLMTAKELNLWLGYRDLFEKYQWQNHANDLNHCSCSPQVAGFLAADLPQVSPKNGTSSDWLLLCFEQAKTRCRHVRATKEKNNLFMVFGAGALGKTPGPVRRGGWGRGPQNPSSHFGTIHFWITLIHKMPILGDLRLRNSLSYRHPQRFCCGENP